MNDQERPVFLVGTGRCGSTFQQAVLSQLSDLWIWGEHDGVIGELLRWMTRVEESPPLRQLSYAADRNAISTLMNDRAEIEANQLSWLNYFRPEDVRELVAVLIRDLFRRGLPPGKTRWGFKEIRYGARDRTAEILFSLFPQCRLVHTVRHPFDTIESSILSWNLPVVVNYEKTRDPSEIIRLYEQYLKNWVESTNYYMNLGDQGAVPILLSKIEEFDREIPKLMTFLGVTSDISEERLKALTAKRVNMSRSTNRTTAVDDLFRRQRDSSIHELVDPARRAGYQLW
jgi:hypothetical protein